MKHLTGAEAAHAEAHALGSGDCLLPGADPVFDHERGRVVRGAPTAGVNRQFEMEDGLARRRGHADAEEPAPARIADAREGETGRVGAWGEEPQRHLRTDDVNLP